MKNKQIKSVLTCQLFSGRNIFGQVAQRTTEGHRGGYPTKKNLRIKLNVVLLHRFFTNSNPCLQSNSLRK
jgi:hypothetical protein